MRHWHRLPIGVVEVWETLKVRLDGALSILILLWVSPFTAVELG